MSNILTELTEGAEIICIHFSSRKKPAGKYHRYPTPRGVSNVYVNPGTLDWYLDGLPDDGGLDGSVAALHNIIKESKASRVVCIGSSMGAWGAAYMAPMIGAHQVIMFGPELELNLFGSYSTENIAARPGPLPVIKSSANCDYVAIAGMNSPCDIYTTIRFLGNLSGLYILPLMGHATAYQLNELGLLDGVIDGLINDHDTRPVLNALSFPGNAEMQAFFAGREYNQQTIIDYVDHFMPAKHGDKFVTGVASDLIVKKLNGNAFALLAHVAQSTPLSNDLKMLYLRCARKSKRNAAALITADELAKSPAHRKHALWEKALVLERMKRSEEAHSIMATICREHLEEPIYKTAAAKIAASTQTPLT